MRDPLDINYCYAESYSIGPTSIIREHSRKMMSIQNFKKKLEYYNKHICSLSYRLNPEGLHSFGQYDNHHGEGETIFQISGKDYTNEKFEAYLEVRQEEIARIKGLVEKGNSYSQKLKYFIEEKAGQFRLDELTIYSTEYSIFLAKGAGETPPHLLGDNIEVTVEPNSAEETALYNLYQRDYLHQLILTPETFYRLVHHTYQGFLFEPGIAQFKKQLKEAITKESAIETELRRIERKYNVHHIPDYLDLLYKSFPQSDQDWMPALFTAFCNGVEYNYGKRKLTIYQVKKIFHAEQVFNYYREVYKLKNSYEVFKENDYNLKDVFEKEEYFDLCINLLKELKVLDNFGRSLISKQDGRKRSGKGFLVFGIITALLQNSTAKLIRNNFDENDILKTFNKYLGTDFKTVRKRKSKKKETGYDKSVKEARYFLSKHC